MWRRCAANGASARTIEILSRLGPSLMRRYVFGGAIPVHRGRNAYRDPIAFQCDSARAKLELSTFCSQYQRGRQGDVAPLESLVYGYERTSSLFAHPVVKFDHCFMTVSQLEGLWLAERPTLRLVGCRTCTTPVLASRLESFVSGCPICAWRDEMTVQPRAALKHRTRALCGCAPEAAMQHRRADFDVLVEEIRALTVDRRVIARLLDASPYRDFLDDSLRRCLPMKLKRTLRIEHLAQNVSTIDLLQYSLALAGYQRLRAVGHAHEAVLKSYAFLRDEFKFLNTLPFERVFDFISQFDGETWGGPTRLRLDNCGACHRDFVASIVDSAVPVCPFCRLSRRPGSYLKQRWVGPKHNEPEPSTLHSASWRATFLG